jgi:AcrR family transcriptional regulator
MSPNTNQKITEQDRRAIINLLAMPEFPKTGRQRLIGVGIELFYRHGFSPVGLDRILATAGVSKTTFYKHFESKDELVLAVLQTRNEIEQRSWTEALGLCAGENPRDQLIGRIDVLDIWFSADYYNGCQFINAAAEFPNPNDPVHQRAAAYKREHRDAICQLAAAAGADDPDVFADAYTTLYEGALVMRQIHNRADAAKLARPLFEKLIGDHIPDV